MKIFLFRVLFMALYLSFFRYPLFSSAIRLVIRFHQTFCWYCFQNVSKSLQDHLRTSTWFFSTKFPLDFPLLGFEALLRYSDFTSTPQISQRPASFMVIDLKYWFFRRKGVWVSQLPRVSCVRNIEALTPWGQWLPRMHLGWRQTVQFFCILGICNLYYSCFTQSCS